MAERDSATDRNPPATAADGAPLRVNMALAVTSSELVQREAGRLLWDGPALYSSLIHWGRGRVLPALASSRARDALSILLRLASRPPAAPGWWRASSASRLLRDIAQERHVLPPPGTSVLYGHITYPRHGRLPVIWSTQGVIEANRGIWFPEQSARTHARFARRASAVQCWSELGRRGMLELCPEIDQAKVRVVPPLAYLDMSANGTTRGPDPADRPGDNGDMDTRVLFVGDQAWRKGLPVLIEAFSRLGPGAVLRVVSSDAKPGRLPSSVNWLGQLPREQVLREIRAAHVHALLSRTESFGMVALEALAAGLPQVLARDTVPAEVAGTSALLVDPDDPACVAEAIERLAGDIELRRAMGSAARERYERFYSPEAVGPKLAALVESVA